MKRNRDRARDKKGSSLLLSIVLIFCFLGAAIFSVSRKISVEMSSSAIQNLRESLGLVKGTIEAILNTEAEFQKLIAQELASVDDPEEFVRSYERNQTMVRVSVIRRGEDKGISNMGQEFSEDELDFSAGKSVGGLPVSDSYLNSMGTWAYTIKCPVVKEGEEIFTLYVEYIYDSFEQALPKEFYNGSAMLYIMDAKSERLVLTPTGMGERNAGHLNLENFYRANNILEEDIQDEIDKTIKSKRNYMFYHDIRGKDSLIYMWAVNDGGLYLIGYVPIEAIQQEGETINQNVFMVVMIMLAAFSITCLLYYFNQRQQNRIRKEREEEREIHNKQLAEALQAAEIASRSKTTFLSNMSHDIRTPMNAILGFTTLLAKDADNPLKVREYTRKIMASGQHLLSLINDVLDVSKIESGKVVLTMSEFTLSGLIDSVDAIIRPMAKAKGQNFDVAVTDIEHEYLVGDETRINQILINLLSNAVKYTPEGGNIWFRLMGLKQHDGQYEHIRIEVEDDGYGMTQEYLKTIFDAFTRAENSTTNKVQGTGLGMAITKNIVELMGGTIEVTSEVNKGSLFRVELKLRIGDSQGDEEFWKKNGIFKILAVDHDKENCTMIRQLMKDTGVEVEVAVNGESALGMIRDASEKIEGYDLILLERKMPGMDGVRTADRIRKELNNPVPILFLTSYDGDEEDFHMEHCGVLTKPFFVSSLKERIVEMHAAHGKEKEERCSSLKGLHFLVAEDNEINAEILEELLSIEEADCVIVENGQMALESFRDSSPGEFDAILMDVQMPVMNGYEAARAIRALGREDAGEIPIIAMTANAFAEDVKDALDAGMNVHVSKPIDMELLKKAVRHCIEGKEWI